MILQIMVIEITRLQTMILPVTIIPACYAALCRAGKTQWVHDYLASSLPALPQCGKKAVADLVESRPDFHPLSGWTHVQQLHGHKVAAVVSTSVFRIARCTEGILVLQL